MNAFCETVDDYLNSLNPTQRQAVETLEGPLLVLAGAGTGKTRVLTTRIAHLLQHGGVNPYQILAVTFTNKAAKEMVGRIDSLVPFPVEGMWLGTFHAICARMLRKHAALVSLKPDFTIIDSDDQLRLIKTILSGLYLDEKRYAPKVALGIIQRWKDQGWRPDQVPLSESSRQLYGKALPIYEAYQLRLRTLGAVDFGDLLLHMVTIFMQYPEILAEYHTRFRYLLVDEYQDTNIAQYLWLRLLAQSHHNICCVGDDDQSIYGWRGAEVGNILRFEQDFPGATTIRLEQNYRSTPQILAAASTLIANNENRLGKTLWTDSHEGEALKILACQDDRDEARSIAKEIETLRHQKQISYADMAILVRAGFQTRSFEECFMNLGIPYRVIGGLRFYERLEIKDVIAYIRVMVQPNDDLALERIINTPRRGIGDTTLAQLMEHAKLHQLSLMESITHHLNYGDLKRAKQPLQALSDSFQKWRQQLDHLPHYEVIETMLHESGYLEMWRTDTSPEAAGRVENIQELLRALQEFPSATAFLEHVSLVTDKEMIQDEAMVTLMTLHGAKGLEFYSVFLPGWEEGIFPHARSIEEKGNAGLEEERRLAYVGITRARYHAYISYAQSRKIFNQWQYCQPSRFIEELPHSHIEFTKKKSTPTPHHFDDFDIDQTHHYEEPSSHQKTASFAVNATSLKGGWRPGSKVIHENFGTGIILAIQGDIVEVSFRDSGKKKLLKRFLTLQ